MIEIATGTVLAGHLPRRAQSLVNDWLAAHRDEIQANWDAAAAGQPLAPVPPLD